MKKYAQLGIIGIFAVFLGGGATYLHGSIQHKSELQAQLMQKQLKAHENKTAKPLLNSKNSQSNQKAKRSIQKNQSSKNVQNNKFVNMPNKTLAINASNANNQITAKVLDIQTGQLLITNGPKAKQRYVLIHISLENKGTQNITFNSQDFTLNVNNKLIPQSNDINTVSSKSIIDRSIKVGERITGYLLFDTDQAENANKKLIIKNQANNTFKEPLIINLANKEVK